MGSRRREEEEDKMTAEDGSTGASLFIHDSHNYLRHFSTQPAPMLAEYRSHRRRRKAVMGMSWSANPNTQPALILGECRSQVRVHVPVNFFCEKDAGTVSPAPSVFGGSRVLRAGHCSWRVPAPASKLGARSKNTTLVACLETTAQHPQFGELAHPQFGQVGHTGLVYLEISS
jgi:hypothetical protein